MTQWTIQPSYKYDLACFCNLFSGEPTYVERHAAAYERFTNRFDPAVAAFAGQLLSAGVIPGAGLAYLLSHHGYDGFDIEAILSPLDDDAVWRDFPDHARFAPQLKEMLRHAHDLGLADYWRAECLPGLEARCREFAAEASRFPVIEAANELLGQRHAVTGDGITLYVAQFAAPHGIRLKGLSFVADRRWKLAIQVDIALHELLHPPFDRERLKELADRLKDDEFLQEAKERLPTTSGYAEMSGFLEENIVEGAHIWLAERMGVVEDPLKYFIEHDAGTHVLSVIVYDRLRSGIRDTTASLEEAIFAMVEDGTLASGKLRRRYLAIYERAGKSGQHPYRG